MDDLHYHGILVDASFSDARFPLTFKNFAQQVVGSWRLHGIEVPYQDLTAAIERIQPAMKADVPFYAHLYNDTDLIVIFRERIFRVTPDTATWKPIIEYGENLGIPKEQLDFRPNRFQDERDYFAPEDFLA